MAINHSSMKLGRKPARFDARVPKFGKYLTARLPMSPPVCDWSLKVPFWGMLANDRLGDCTAAGAAHAVQVWTSNASTEAEITDTDTIRFYSDSAGYTPNDPSSDQGAVELDVLTYWLKNDFAGHKLDAFANLDVGNRTNIKDAIWLTGGVYIGVNLPISAQSQEDVWDVPQAGTTGDGKPGSWGGHCVVCIGYTDKYLTFVSWGRVMTMTWDFWNAYVEEAWVLLSKDWLRSNGVSPSGFRYDDLIEDMKALDPEQDPVQRLQQAVGDPVLFEFHWKDVTLDIRQAAATYVLGLIASAFATYGYMVDSNVSTFMGIVIGVMAGFHHLTTISKSNISTRELVEVFSDLISVLQKKRIH